MSLDDYWQRQKRGLERLADHQRNLEVELLLDKTAAFIAFTTSRLPQGVTKNAELLGTLDGLDVLAFDGLRSCLAAQRVHSLVGVALAARTLFEALCTMRFITESGDKAPLYANRYARWESAEVLRFHAKLGEPMPWDTFESHALQAAEWMERDSFKVASHAHWANESRLKTLQSMASHLGLEREYRTLYATGSVFTHATPASRRGYLDGELLRLIPNARMLAEFSIAAARSALDLHRAFVGFHGIAFDEDDLLQVTGQIIFAYAKTRSWPEADSPPTPE